MQPPRIMKETHLKLRVMENTGRIGPGYDAVGWRMADRSTRDSLVLGDELDLAYTLDYNSHPDFGGLQLNLLDFQRPGSQRPSLQK